MALIQLTDTENNNGSVLINPDHIIYVQTLSGKTYIGTTAINGAGTTRVFAVSEDERSVWKLVSPPPGR